MQRLWPDPGEVDDLEAMVAAEARPPRPGRPWLLVNMVASLDGAIAVDGRSGGLGGPADKAMFSALRGIADVILVGAGTVRAEGYGPPRPSDATRAARRARGQAEAPRLAIVTRSLALDPAARCFADAEAGAPPCVVTCASAPDDRRAELDQVARVVSVGDDAVDLHGALADLAADGAGVVLCEGGPSLNGDLAAAGLIDEWDLTLSPLLAGGHSPRATDGAALPDPTRFALDRLVQADSLLLGRWLATSVST